MSARVQRASDVLFYVGNKLPLEPEIPSTFSIYIYIVKVKKACVGTEKIVDSRRDSFTG